MNLKYKPGQIITILGKKYRIRRVPHFGIHACPYCHIHTSDDKVCNKYCSGDNDGLKKILPQNCVLCQL